MKASLLGAFVLLFASQPVFAATLVVPGNANIFGAGHSVPPAPGGMGAGELPPVFSFPAATNQVLVFSSVTGSVRLDADEHPGYTNGPEGGWLFGLFSRTDVYSYGGIAGIVDSGKTMFLVGVFLDDTEPADPAPDRLDFSSAALGENFTTLAPALRQVFFVGDGINWTRSGTVAPRFTVPNGATRLYLGFADSWDGTNVVGFPGFYGDDDGSVTANFGFFTPTNNWTKATSGNWEEPVWSLGQLPGTNEDVVAINSAGWKAVAIGANTTANYPQSLTGNNLTIDGPANSFNTLLLNWALLNVPLVVKSDLNIGTNGALVSHYSALKAANAYIDGSASFMDYATEEFRGLTIRSGGTVGLTNGIMTTSNLTFYTGKFIQSGGTHTVENINNVAGDYYNYSLQGEYDLNGGTLISQSASLGAGGGYNPDGHGFIHQTSGVHTNTSMGLGGWSHHWSTTSLGSYGLDGGLLVSSSVYVWGGSFSQSGGTNRIQELDVNSGRFWLTGGELVTSNVSVNVGSEIGEVGFFQTGGVHCVQGQLLINGDYGDYEHDISYQLSGGLLLTSNILVQSGALGLSSQGTVSNAGIVTLTGGYLVGSSTSATQYLGQLQLSASPTNYPWDVQRTGGSLDLSYYFSQPAAMVWRFADSHTLPWSGKLQISDWGAGSHIFFGTNSWGLTPEQLRQVIFIRPSGGSSDFAADLTATGELVPLYFDYTVTNGTVTVERYLGPDLNVIIPNTINGLPVTSIGRLLTGYESVTNVAIPGSVTNIAVYALWPSGSLMAISVDPNNAFYSSVDGVLFDKSHASLLQFPGGRGGAYAIPKGVASIGDYAFAYCTSLTNVTIPDSVTAIGKAAFYGSGLTAITIPASVTTIGDSTFDCPLTTITVDPLNSFYHSEDGVLFNKSQTILIRYPQAKAGSYTIPDSVTNLADGAFSVCQSLTGIAIPNTVMTIGEGAFKYCRGLTNVTIPDGVTTVEAFTFDYCDNLANVTIGNAVTSIGDDAFLYCRHLTSIIIPNGVTAIGNFAFWECNNLTNITIPDSVVALGENVFGQCTNLTSITMPRSLTSIGLDAFNDCTSLNAVYFRGNAPDIDPNLAVFYYSTPTVYYLPGTTGWGSTFAGRPTAPWYLPTPMILNFGPSFGLQSNRFGFVISWASNAPVVVEACTNLTMPAWVPIATNILTNGSVYFNDPIDYPARYYRLRLPVP